MGDVAWASQNFEYDEFFSAVSTGNVAALESITFCADFNFNALHHSDVGGIEGIPALHIAAGNGHVEMVKFLEKGADINVRHQYTYGSFMPLLVAASRSNAEMVAVLLDHGAHINDRGGYLLGTALYLVLHHEERKVERKSIDTIKLLLNRSMDVNNAGNEYGATVVSWRPRCIHHMRTLTKPNHIAS
jgi:ankyrin repeat protein